MSEIHWLMIVWSLLIGSWLAWPYIDSTKSVTATLVFMNVTAFAMGITFRGIVDGLVGRREVAVDHKCRTEESP